MQLKHAWANVLELNLGVERVESNPQLVQIVPPNEVVVLISFELTLGDMRGMMNLCIPFNAIERISSKLTANSWVGYSRGAATRADSGCDRPAAAGGARGNGRDAGRDPDHHGRPDRLRVGDIITTDKDIHSPLEVAVQGMTKFLASPGALKGHKAIQVQNQPLMPTRAWTTVSAPRIVAFARVGPCAGRNRDSASRSRTPDPDRIMIVPLSAMSHGRNLPCQETCSGPGDRGRRTETAVGDTVERSTARPIFLSSPPALSWSLMAKSPGKERRLAP